MMCKLGGLEACPSQKISHFYVKMVHSERFPEVTFTNELTLFIMMCTPVRIGVHRDIATPLGGVIMRICHTVFPVHAFYV